MIPVISKIKNYFKKSAAPADSHFVWKYIDLDDNLVNEIKDIYLKNIKKDLTQYGSYQTLDVVVPDIMGYKVAVPALFYMPAGYIPRRSHKDPISHSSLALNIPIINCENSRTIFYECEKTDKILYKERITETAPIKKCHEIDSYVLDKPILLNTQILHAVFNYGNTPRLSISLRFEKNPVEWI